MTRIAYFMMVSVLVACAPKNDGDSATDTDATTGAGTSTTTGPTTGTTTGTTTDELTPEEAELCGCLDEASCGDELCATFMTNCTEDCDASREANIECALTALRDRTPGRVQWFWSDTVDHIQRDTTVYIRAEGRALVVRYVAADLTYTSGPDTLHMLEEPEYYAGCVALTDVQARVSCLVDGLGEETAVCRESSSHSTL